VSRLNVTNRVTDAYNRQAFKDILSDIQTQVNNLSEGHITATYNAQLVVPTTGQYAVGDFVPNKDIVELGVPGVRYVLRGWVCSVSDPLTFLECRFLTGN
jgi:hypothetical protein